MLNPSCIGCMFLFLQPNWTSCLVFTFGSMACWILKMCVAWSMCVLVCMFISSMHLSGLRVYCLDCVCSVWSWGCMPPFSERNAACSVVFGSLWDCCRKRKHWINWQHKKKDFSCQKWAEVFVFFFNWLNWWTTQVLFVNVAVYLLDFKIHSTFIKPTRTLRSAGRGLRVIPNTGLQTKRNSVEAVRAPHLWNNLPVGWVNDLC